MSWHQPKFKESNTTTPGRCSLPVLTCPIPGVNTPYLLEEDWQQLLTDNTSWAPLALNTNHPEYTGFFLVEEKPLQDLGGGHVRWTRVYAKKPATHYEPEGYSYSFPGSADAILNQSPNSRTDRVDSRVKHEYFLVGPTGTGLATPDYADDGAIPQIWGTIFCMTGPVAGVTVGAPWARTTYVSNGITIAGNVFVKTTPSFTEYQAMLNDAIANGWGGTVCFQNVDYDSTNQVEYIPLTGGVGVAAAYGGIIIADNSIKTRWRGNIFLRKTRYVLAI